MRRRVLLAGLLLLPGCEREPEPAANVALEGPAPARPTLPPPARAETAVGRDDLALERTMIPELDGVAPLAGRWTGSGERAVFVAETGAAFGIACDGARGDIVLRYRPDAAPADGEQSLTLLTERGTNLFTAMRSPGDARVVEARFTAQLPFFADALAAGDGVIGLLLGSRAAVAIPSDAAVGAVVEGCR